ncbi:formylmethanofuran dehydrogenase, partial [candidate division MSBL1 archaeon SCGC-AAA261F19]
MYPRGFFRDSGERDRNLVVVDIRKTDTAKLADHFIQVEPNQDYELLASIRVLLNGGEIPEEVAGVPSGDIEKLAEMMKNCNYGALFFGLGLTMSKGKYMNIDNAISLVEDLNDYT